MKVHIGPYRKNRKVEIKIDKYDTWSMDQTLALIILPMLMQLKETKHGSPYVDDDDLPTDFIGDIHERWGYILNEMIWAFSQKTKEYGWETEFFESYGEFTTKKIEGTEHSELVWITPPVYDQEGIIKCQERMNNAFKLFGKYYENLWD